MFPRFSHMTRCFVLITKRFNHQSAILKDLIDDFPNYFPKIVESSLIDKKYADNIEIRERITKVSTYHTSARDPIQGNLTMLAFDALADQKHLTTEKLHQIKVLAWAVEMVQSYFVIGDDMDENSKTRCGKICWHLLPDVGFSAINDASLLRSFICEILEHNFDESMSFKMLKIFNEVFFSINIGQHIDAKVSRSTDFSEFTMDQYNIYSKYKTVLYTVAFPIFLALELCNKANNDSYKYVDKMSSDLGTLLQIQNDLMDYTDFDSVSLKTSSDIQLKKLSWVAVAVLENCNESQRKVMETCYGQWDSEKVERIRQLYKEFDILALYRKEEQKRYRSTMQQINNVPVNATPSADFFHKILNFFRQYTLNISSSTLCK